MKNNADAIIFHTAICAGASQISLDGRREIAFANFSSPRRIRSGMGIFMNTKTDLRIIKTHKALCESFAALIEKKKFEEITVNELCDHAMIRRATFYKHFADKYEFFAFFVQQIQESIIKQYSGTQANSPGSSSEYYLFVFHGAIRFLSGHIQLVNNILHSSVFSTLLDILSLEIQRNILLHLTDESENKICQPADAHVLSAFLAGGIIQLLRYWLTNSDTVSAEKICSEFEKILSSASTS